VLTDALGRVREERSPQLVTLVSAPGLGKSRLVHELFEVVEESPDLISWRQGRSLPYGEGVSYWALGEIVKAQAGILETDDADAAASKLAAAVADVADDDAHWLETQLGPLVGLGGAVESQADRRGEAFAAWRRFLEALAEERALVLVFEDLHWADDGLLDFVDHLVDWASDVPLLVVATARPELLERRPGWGGGKRNATALTLSPLSDSETARLIASLLDRPVLPADEQAELIARAGGNPLFAEEYARMLANGEIGEIPDTLHGIIAARLDSLPVEDKALVQNAAVVGKVFWRDALAVLRGLERVELENRLHALAQKEFVRRERRSSVEGGVEYSFLHALIRDVAYAQIPRAGRAERHLAVAAWLEGLGRPEDAAEMLAHHYLAALEYARSSVVDDEATAGRARRALGEAAARAFSLSAFEACERFAIAALDFAEPGSADWSRLLLQRVRAAWRTSTHSQRVFFENARNELEAAGYRDEAAEAGSFASWSAWIAGDVEAAETAIRRAARLLETAPPSRAKVSVLSGLARLLAMANSAQEAEEVAGEAIAMATSLGLADLEAEALNNRGLARNNAGDPRGIEDIERSIELARLAGSPTDVVRGQGNLASELYGFGEVARAFELHEAALGDAEKFGIEGAMLWQRAERVEYDYTAGRWDEAIARANNWLATGVGRPPHFMDGIVRALRALILVARGDIAAALADDEFQVEQARALDPQAAHASLALSSFIRVLAGEQAMARERLEELLGHWRDAPLAVTFNPCEPAFAAVLLGQADAFLAAAEGTRETRWLAAATAFVRGRPAEAARLFDEIGSLPNAAYVRLHDPATLERALAFYRSVGATLLVRRGEELLAATG
jgi:hypothetical protein